MSDKLPGNGPIRFRTVNVGTITGRGNKVVEMLTSREVDLCCLQEIIWRGRSAHLVKGKNSIYKFFRSSFSFFFSVMRYDHCCLQLHLLVGTIILNVIRCYAIQSGLSAEEKDAFYDKIISFDAAVSDEEMLLINRDFNGHVG